MLHNTNSASSYSPSSSRTQLKSTSKSTSTISANIYRFLLLPSHVLIILLLEFLNSFRSFGLRFVLYNYITNEFKLPDKQAGKILGIKSLTDIGFGLCGSILVDYVGVRCVSLLALSVAIVSRALLAFTRSTCLLYVSLFILSPCGDALLSVGLYRVALKKLSTPLTRPICFALSYTVSNMAGVCVAIVVDYMRKNRKDVHINLLLEEGDSSFSSLRKFVNDNMIGGVYTPVRQFIVLTWLVLFVTFFIAYFSLEDWTVIDLHDLDEEYCNYNNNNDEKDGHDSIKATPMDNAVSVKPMVGYEILQKYVISSNCSTEQDDEEGSDEAIESSKLLKINASSTYNETTARDCDCNNRLPVVEYKMYKTQHTKSSSKTYNNEGGTTTTPTIYSTPCILLGNVVHVIKQFITIIRMRNTWKVLVFSFVSVPTVLQWTASEMVLPPFLERRFGESIPIYTIQSIHMIGCIMLPPFAQALTSDLEDFRVVMPGLWIMAISPIFVALLPNILGACIWQIFMTFGQILWSPRQDSWTGKICVLLRVLSCAIFHYSLLIYLMYHNFTLCHIQCTSPNS